MYIVQVYYKRKLQRFRIYHSYENALSDITDGLLCEDLDINKIDFEKPTIHSCSLNNLNFKTDFEFRYGNDIVICVGTPAFADYESEVTK